VRGVPFPADADYAFTWNLPGAFAPNPQFRRYGTEKLVLTVECVLETYRARHPDMARIGVADISLTRGGPFGRRYGGLGHASHQNGRDADVLYPRFDGCECPADVP
jgi:murein endopeptidase